MSARDDIVATLDGLVVALEDEADTKATVHAYRYEPGHLGPYAAWPVWVSTRWRTACVPEHRYTALVVLTGGSPGEWSAQADALVAPIRSALLGVGHVESVEPVTLPTGDATTTVPALAFSLVI